MARCICAVGITVGVALMSVAIASAEPIGGATYHGASKQNGHRTGKVDFTVSTDGRQIGSLDIGFDSHCRQGHKRYIVKRASMIFYSVKVDRDGTFEARDKRRYHGGGDVSKAHGHFSANGKRARGRFAYRGRFHGGGVEPVHCHARGIFKAKTHARP